MGSKKTEVAELDTKRNINDIQKDSNSFDFVDNCFGFDWRQVRRPDTMAKCRTFGKWFICFGAGVLGPRFGFIGMGMMGAGVKVRYLTHRVSSQEPDFEPKT